MSGLGEVDVHHGVEDLGKVGFDDVVGVTSAGCAEDINAVESGSCGAGDVAGDIVASCANSLDVAGHNGVGKSEGTVNVGVNSAAAAIVVVATPVARDGALNKGGGTLSADAHKGEATTFILGGVAVDGGIGQREMRLGGNATSAIVRGVVTDGAVGEAARSEGERESAAGFPFAGVGIECAIHEGEISSGDATAVSACLVVDDLTISHQGACAKERESGTVGVAINIKTFDSRPVVRKDGVVSLEDTSVLGGDAGAPVGA